MRFDWIHDHFLRLLDRRAAMGYPTRKRLREIARRMAAEQQTKIAGAKAAAELEEVR